ncbi:MAG: hypothetical protein ACC707_05240 [Thiohalomonadales bacterium]
MSSNNIAFKSIGTIFAFVCLLTFSSMSLAGDSDLKTMAQIMLKLNHYPSDAEKQTLKGIVSASSEAHHKTLASAMINLQHKANAADIPKLKSIVSDGKASQSEKDMANILLGLNHSPSDADKAKLKNIM